MRTLAIAPVGHVSRFSFGEQVGEKLLRLAVEEQGDLGLLRVSQDPAMVGDDGLSVTVLLTGTHQVHVASPLMFQRIECSHIPADQFVAGQEWSFLLERLAARVQAQGGAD